MVMKRRRNQSSERVGLELAWYLVRTPSELGWIAEDCIDSHRAEQWQNRRDLLPLPRQILPVEGRVAVDCDLIEAVIACLK